MAKNATPLVDIVATNDKETKRTYRFINDEDAGCDGIYLAKRLFKDADSAAVRIVVYAADSPADAS